jgi:hypothetical protein
MRERLEPGRNDEDFVTLHLSNHKQICKDFETLLIIGDVIKQYSSHFKVYVLQSLLARRQQQ